MASTKKNSNNNNKHKQTVKKDNNIKNLFNGFMRFCKSETVHFILGVVFSLFGAFLLIALTSFFFTGKNDQSIVENVPFFQLFSIEDDMLNWAGAIGAYISNLLVNKWIGIAAYVFALWICIAGLRLMRVIENGFTKVSILCALGCIILSLTFGFIFQLTESTSFITWGGNHGKVITDILFKAIGPWGTGIIILIFFVLLMVMISRSTIQFIRTALTTNPFRNPFVFKKREVVSEEVEDENAENEEESPTPVENNDEDSFVFVTEDEIDENEVVIPQDDVPEAIIEEDAPFVEDEVEVNDTDPIMIDVEPTVLSRDGEPVFTVSTGAKEELVEEVLQDYDPTLDLPRYRKPTLDLLADLPDCSGSVDRNELESNKKRITDTLMTYGIEISSIQATVGPTVTLYEIIPAPGVRIAKIKNLEDDIALSLSALGIRIIAPIPGKGTVGIEVPNNDPQTVSMRSIIASRKFQESKYELPIALGKTITNEVFVADLSKMPHVLVAGATGQGKSVGLNAIITSLLYKKHPAELKFVLVDPKKVEFSIYSAIERHFLAKLPDTEEPIITDTTKVVQTLQSVTREMDMRYDLLKAAKVRTIKEYNAKFKSRHLLPSKGHRFLPYIVVVIDEFSDLIMTAGKEVESPIIRIAQLARAVGIHMIIATQRPSTNVITGIIKANFPARIAFRVQSMIDSRTILDCPGANQLIGRGDMLVSQGGEMVRVQCAFVDTPEVEDICGYISEQQSYPDAFLLPEYVGEESESSGAGFEVKDRDPLFEEAARIIVSSQQASTSSLQRRYSIGYNRAGRLMDQLEAAGIVGPAVGGRPREVLVMDIMQLENKLESMQ